MFSQISLKISHPTYKLVPIHKLIFLSKIEEKKKRKKRRNSPLTIPQQQFISDESASTKCTYGWAENNRRNLAALVKSISKEGRMGGEKWEKSRGGAGPSYVLFIVYTLTVCFKCGYPQVLMHVAHIPRPREQSCISSYEYAWTRVAAIVPDRAGLITGLWVHFRFIRRDAADWDTLRVTEFIIGGTWMSEIMVISKD